MCVHFHVSSVDMLLRFDRGVAAHLVSFLSPMDAASVWFCCKGIYQYYLSFIVPKLLFFATSVDVCFVNRETFPADLTVSTPYGKYVRRVKLRGRAFGSNDNGSIVSTKQIKWLDNTCECSYYNPSTQTLPAQLETLNTYIHEICQPYFPMTPMTTFLHPIGTLPSSLTNIIIENSGSILDLFTEDNSTMESWWKQHPPFALKGVYGFGTAINTKTFPLDVPITSLDISDIPIDPFCTNDTLLFVLPRALTTLKLRNVSATSNTVHNRSYHGELVLRHMRLDLCPNLQDVSIHTRNYRVNTQDMIWPRSLRTLRLDFPDARQSPAWCDCANTTFSALELLDVGEWSTALTQLTTCFPNLKRLPSASSGVFQNFCAMYSLITATRPVTPLSAHSCCVNMRPRKSGTRSVSRYRGETQRISSSGSDPGCTA